MFTAPLLIAAAAGYWVLERAERQRGRLKTIGRIVAGLILVLSFAGVVCKVWYACGASGKGWCPLANKPGCPIKAMTDAPAAK